MLVEIRILLPPSTTSVSTTTAKQMKNVCQCGRFSNSYKKANGRIWNGLPDDKYRDPWMAHIRIQFVYCQRQIRKTHFSKLR